MRATQKDIARSLNISRSAVANVLSNQRGVRVAEETRQRILEAAEDIGYRPNAAASNLRRGKTGVVMLVCRYNPAGDRLPVGAALDTLIVQNHELGYDFRVRPFASHESLLAGLREIVTTSVCDGIVLWMDEEDGEAAGELLEELDFPFVAKGRYEVRHPHWFQADFDHEAMMSQAVDHLAGHGHSRIAYIGFESPQVYIERLRSGFAQAMRRRFDKSVPEAWLGQLGEGHDVADALVSEWLSVPAAEQPTAVVIGAGYAAWNGLELALARQGRRLGMAPGDFEAIGERPLLAPLLYGEALGYRQVHFDSIARQLTKMLDRRLKPAEALSTDRVARIVPPLQRLGTLGLPLGTFDSYTIPAWPDHKEKQP